MKGHFLQSLEWEAFQKVLGRKVWRVDDALVIKFSLTLDNSYLYKAGSSTLPGIESIKNIAKKENVVFLKFEPMLEGRELADNLLSAGFIKSKKEIQPQKTTVLDLMKSEEELLAGMHEKTRYNIRLARKKDLRFTIYDFSPEADLSPRLMGRGFKPRAERFDDSKLDEFWQVLQKTTLRDKFSSHYKGYYEELLKLSLVKLFVVEYRDKMIAANIILFHEERATYLHGASDYEYRNLMAPYLLHWETIKYAKEHKFREYDFWGIDENKWPGLTRFKRGFGGREVEYLGSYDYVFQPFWYKLYKLQSFIKRFS